MRRKIEAVDRMESTGRYDFLELLDRYDLQCELVDNRISYNFHPQLANAERFLLSQLPPRVDQTPDLRPSTRRGTRRAWMWLINRASHEVSRGTNSDAINRNQRSRKDKPGKIAILMLRYSVHIVF